MAPGLNENQERASTGVISADQLSNSNDPISTTKAQDFLRNRKSVRLSGMVDSLHESMKQMIEKREFYAERSRILERKLKDASPDSLEKVVEIPTIQIADIIMELEDLQGQVQLLEERCQKLQEEKNDEQQANQNHIQILRKQVEILELRSTSKHEQLLADLKEANDESATLQEMYRSMRRNFSSATMNIATMASTISKLQQENNSLRIEADSSHKALVALELQRQELLAGKNIRTGQAIESQLIMAQFESEKLVAERTANQTVIAELQAQVRFLQGALAYRTRANKRGSVARPIASSSMTHVGKSSSPSTQQLNNNSFHASDKLDKVQGTIESMRSCDSDGETESVASSLSDMTPKQANTSTELDEPVQILRKLPLSPERPSSEPHKARRMPVEINGMSGNYTGPLNEAGLPHGTGTIRFLNGDTYLGALYNGLMHGRGAMYFGNKRKPTFRGDFVSNRPVM